MERGFAVGILVGVLLFLAYFIRGCEDDAKQRGSWGWHANPNPPPTQVKP